MGFLKQLSAPFPAPFAHGLETAQTAHLQDATPEAVRAPRASVSELPKVAAFYRPST